MYSCFVVWGSLKLGKECSHSHRRSAERDLCLIQSPVNRTVSTQTHLVELIAVAGEGSNVPRVAQFEAVEAETPSSAELWSGA